MEKPILFATPMVQALLDGRKKMTRRIIKPTPIVHNEAIGTMPCSLNEYAKKLGEYRKKGYTNLYTEGALQGMMTSEPKYQVGDVLWVRETFCPIGGGKYLYKANSLGDNLKWKPSLFMPKEACRIFLEVTKVRAERLQDINWQDIIDEGLQADLTGIDGIQELEHKWESLWVSLNGQQSWDDNPFVWVVEFERILNK